jgi:uncharacterized protein (DUF169 family)
MTTDCRDAERQITRALGDLRAVAVAYLEALPKGVTKFEGTVPAGCSFWSLAAKGRSFYTVPSDHFNCPIGSYTHAIDLPPERNAELEQTLALMTSVGYVRMEEVPAIPRLSRTPAFTYYAPLAAAVVDPDVVIFAGRGCGIAVAVARTSDVHGLAGRDDSRLGDEHGLHRQPRLHGPWRARVLPHDSW